MNKHQRARTFKQYKLFETTSIWQVKGSPNSSPFFYEAGMSIDFDGAPDAYAPPGSGLVGKDDIRNAVATNDRNGQSPWLHKPKNQTASPTNPRWIPTYKSTVRDSVTGDSIIQTSGKYAGYYISESSLKDYWHAVPGPTQTDPAYQTNANDYPYVVLPGKKFKDSNLSVGDYALAIHGSSGKYTFAVVGDSKNELKMGESSSALARALDVPYDRNGGTKNGIVYVVFPGSGLGPKSRDAFERLESNGMRWLRLYNDRLDLSTHIISCFSPEFSGVTAAFKAMGC